MLNKGIASALATGVCLIALASPAQAQERSFDVPAGSLKSALDSYSRQAGQPIIYKPEEVGKVRSGGYKGVSSPRAALDAILEGTGFSAQAGSTGALAVVRTGTPQGNVGTAGPAAGNSASSQGEETVPEEQQGISEILVVGSRSQNVDIRRTENDPQPYVVYGEQEIKKSGAFNVEEFLRQRLPMNATSPSNDSSSTRTGNVIGGINLRGLGTNQTLILVDGRRIPGVSTSADFAQPSVNGIPPAAIERIEVLPATAGGAYGGGATGGVVNIILKRDYTGLTAEAIYGNVFDGNASTFRLNLTGGISLNEGRTRVMLNASHGQQGDLLSTERPFGKKAFERLMEHQTDIGTDLMPFLLPFVAYGPTPNIISAFGEELVLDPELGGTALGSAWTFVPSGYSGPASDGGAGLVNNAGQLRAAGVPAVLYSAPKTDAVSLGIRQQLNDHIEAYADLYWDSSRSRFRSPEFTTLFIAGSSPDNPFQQDVNVTVPLYQTGFRSMSKYKIEAKRANVGLIVRLPKKWALSADFGIARLSTPSVSRLNSGPTPEGTPSLESIAFSDLRTTVDDDISSLFFITTSRNPAKTDLRTGSLRLSGPIIRLPGGNINFTGLAEIRRESNPKYVQTQETPPNESFFGTPKATRNVHSLYAELRAPVLAENNEVPLVHDFELIGSIRYDSYKTRWAATLVSLPDPDADFPSSLTFSKTKLDSTDFTVGTRYSPIRDVSFRASYSTGLLPPALNQLKSSLPSTRPALSAVSSSIHDPKRNNERLRGDPNSTPAGLITILNGGNPDLKPESSKSLSYGIIVSPRVLPGFRASADITTIRKSDEISAIPSFQILLDNEELFPGRIVRAPLTPSDAAAGMTGGRVIFIDRTALNLFRSKVRALDLQVEYRLESARFGNFNFYGVATRQLEFKRQTISLAAPEDSVGLFNGPLKWKGNTGIDWTYKDWSAGWNAQFFSSYSRCSSSQTAAACASSFAVLAQGSNKVPHQIYNDLYVQYRVPEGLAHFLTGLEIDLGIQNIFNKKPPILNQFAATDGYSSFGDPRLRRFTIGIRKQF